MILPPSWLLASTVFMFPLPRCPCHPFVAQMQAASSTSAEPVYSSAIEAFLSPPQDPSIHHPGLSSLRMLSDPARPIHDWHGRPWRRQSLYFCWGSSKVSYIHSPSFLNAHLTINLFQSTNPILHTASCILPPYSFFTVRRRQCLPQQTSNPDEYPRHQRSLGTHSSPHLWHWVRSIFKRPNMDLPSSGTLHLSRCSTLGNGAYIRSKYSHEVFGVQSIETDNKTFNCRVIQMVHSFSESHVLCLF